MFLAGAVFFLFELDSEIYEAAYGFRAVFYHEADCSFVVVVGACFQGVFDMFFKVIFLVDYGGYASLGVVRVGFCYEFFCYDDNVAFFCCVQSKIKS